MTQGGEPGAVKTSRVFEQVHAFMNVSALVAILAFVAVHRNKKFDLAGLFLEETHLKTAFDTLCSQSLLIGLFATALVVTLRNFEVLTTVTQVYIAFECTIVLLICWMIGGALLLRRAQH